MLRRPRLSFLVVLVIGGAVATIAVWPQLVGIHRLPLVANLLSLRGVSAGALGVLALIVGAVAARRGTWGVSAALALALAAAFLGNAGVLVVRGWGASAVDGDLTVVAWNAYGGGASPESVARLVRDTGADVVSLPETDAFAAAEIVGILAREGVSMRHDTVAAARGGETIPTSILISTALGAYARDASIASTPGLPSGVWRPVDGRGPTLVAAHPMPPLPRVMDQWDAGLRWIAEQCGDPDVIVAGDLNATVDHFAGLGARGGIIGGCRDAAAEVGAGAQGTWPVRLPLALAAPIDHVLVGAGWRAESFSVLDDFDDAGSDHRPIVATLTRR
ncbi:endonuclease/exonuclease/phosphatase family protein [Microbacterium sp. lyk4-40-TSB-66]|uniref:endonuclease/exonuclease/phosphatase family protein n=1 Tax=Microbacterium sp. lyk4-40-TSB-66 TaxID=3040294 RepID=UPI00254F61C4|nr:endonuclease/exonuclease/phosphatase family protein [Microbacterium sp. lyk4-40-TSB-66]